MQNLKQPKKKKKRERKHTKHKTRLTQKLKNKHIVHARTKERGSDLITWSFFPSTLWNWRTDLSFLRTIDPKVKGKI